MADDAARVERLAERAAEKAARDTRGRGDPHGERRDFTITKFGRHPDGYFHAHVTPAGGKHIYVHRKYGSWMAPGEQNGKVVYKEVLPHVAAELSKKAKSAERAERGATDTDAGNGEAAPRSIRRGGDTPSAR